MASSSSGGAPPPSRPRPADEPRFDPVVSRSWTLADEAAEQIRGVIANGSFRPGERLPPERALVEQLNVSRTVLREALSSLEALGIIERRSTRGRFVAAGGSPNRSRILIGAWLHQHADAIAESDEVRAALEGHALRRLSEDDLAEVVRQARRIAADQRAALARGDVRDAAGLDLDLHDLFVSYSPSAALRGLAREMINESRNATLAVYATEQALESVEEHEAIVAALARGDREVASDLLTQHMLASGGSKIATSGGGAAD